MIYLDELTAARERTKAWGLWCRGAEEFAAPSDRRASPSPLELQALGANMMPSEDRAGNCVGVTFGALLQMLMENWGYEPLITIGNVEVDGRPRYQVTRQSVRALLQRGPSDRSILTLHVWLTFPDLVILDLALGPAVLHDRSDVELPGLAANRIVSGHPDALEPGVRYRPFLVGEESLPHRGRARRRARPCRTATVEAGGALVTLTGAAWTAQVTSTCRPSLQVAVSSTIPFQRRSRTGRQ